MLYSKQGISILSLHGSKSCVVFAHGIISWEGNMLTTVLGLRMPHLKVTQKGVVSPQSDIDLDSLRYLSLRSLKAVGHEPKQGSSTA